MAAPGISIPALAQFVLGQGSATPFDRITGISDIWPPGTRSDSIVRFADYLAMSLSTFAVTEVLVVVTNEIMSTDG
jgi:hypothetical protein